MSDLRRFQAEFAAALPRARGRLSVYRNTVAKGLIEALGDTHPTVAALLGDTFAPIAAAYVAANPPRSPVLAGYGRDFAAFLANHPIAHELPYLPDVARLDRLHVEAHLAADAPALQPDELAALAAEGERALVRPHPAARFAWFATPARSIREGHATGAPIDWRSEGALVVRPYGAVSLHPLAPPEHVLLVRLATGAPLLAACAAMLAQDRASDPAASLARLAAAGAFASPRKGPKTWRRP